MFFTRNKCQNDLARVSKSTLIMCSATSLALVNSHTSSRNVVLSLQTLPLHPDTERDWCCRMEWGWLASLYFTVLLLGNNNIRSTTCDSVLSLICGHKGIASEAMHATSVMRAITAIWCVFYAMHTASMRAITLIWCSFIPYHMLLYSWTRPFIRRGRRVWVRAYIQVVPTDTMHMIATVLLIAPLNFATQFAS